MLKINSDETKDKLYKNQIINELIDNTLTICIINNNGLTVTTITEENIVAESMKLKQGIIDEGGFRFGGCIASEFDIQLIDSKNMSFENNLVGKKIVVEFSQKYPICLYPSPKLYPAENLYPGAKIQSQDWTLFVGTIDSALRDKENKFIYNIVAYDPIAQLYSSKKNISNKLYKAMANDKATIKELLQLCLNSTEYEADDFDIYSEIQFRNRLWESEKKKNPNSIKITKGELLRNICEVSCGFAFFRPSELSYEIPDTQNPLNIKVNYGKLRLLNTNDGIHGTEEYIFYESITIDEKSAHDYDGIVFPYSGDIEDSRTGDWGNKTGIFDGTLIAVDDDPDESKNYYDISDNILAWDYSSREHTPSSLQKTTKLYNKLIDISANELDYMPITAILDGRLWVEVGDTIIIKEPEIDLEGNFQYDDNGNQLFAEVKSRVFSRTLTGIKALTDTIEAKGV